MPKVSYVYLGRRRAQILAAATDCFARNGFHRTTMKDIVRQSGRSPGAIYNYFNSKEEIIHALADERHARERRAIREASKQGNFAATVEHLCLAFFTPLSQANQRRHVRMGVQFWAEALRRPDILKIVKRGIDEPHRRLTKLVVKAQARGELPKGLIASAFARVMIAMFQGFILQIAWDPGTPSDSYIDAIFLLVEALSSGACGEASEEVVRKR